MSFSLFNPCAPCCTDIRCGECSLGSGDVLWARMTACAVVDTHYDWNLILEYIPSSGFWYGYVDSNDGNDNYFAAIRFQLKFFCESGVFKIKTKCQDSIETQVSTIFEPTCSPFSIPFTYEGQIYNCSTYPNHEILIRKPSDFSCLDGDTGCNNVPPNNLFLSSNLGDVTLIRNGSSWDGTIGNLIFKLQPDWNQASCGPSLPNCLYTLNVYCHEYIFGSGALALSKVLPSGFSCSPTFFWDWVGSGNISCNSIEVLFNATITE